MITMMGKPGSQFADVRILRAMNMAIDFRAIIKSYLGFRADSRRCQSVLPIWSETWTPIDQLLLYSPELIPIIDAAL